MKDLFSLDEPDKTEVFWQMVEEQHGAVRAFCLSQYFAHALMKGDNKNKTVYWGISYITDKGFFFYHFPQRSMIEALMGKKEPSDFCLGILFENLKSWKYLAPEKKFLKRIVTKKEVGLTIEGISTRYSLEHQGLDLNNNDETTSILCNHTFLLDLKTKQMIATIRAMAGDKEDHHEA